jgi:DNA end-binding protein Ku
MEEAEQRQPRAFWSGVITFGLVSIPVELYSANRPRDVSLRMLDPEGQPLRRRYVCSTDGRPVASDDLVRGYETDEGDMIVVEDEELEALEPKKTREIDLQSFVPRDEIDPIYLLRTYFLLPAGETTKAYRLLAETMEHSNRAGIATFILRGKEQLVAIVAENGILRADTLRFDDEVKDVGEIDVPKKGDAAEAKRVAKAIEARLSEELPIGYLRDDYGQRLHQLVEKKLEEKRGIVPMSEQAAEVEKGEIIDVMQILMKKLGVEPREPPRRAPSKRSRAKTRREHRARRA